MKKLLMTLLMLLMTSAVSADDYILIIVDTSGSMDELMRDVRKTRMEVAKNALKEVLADIPTSTKVAILSFNGWVYNEEFRTIDKEEMTSRINEMRSSGGTPLYSHIQSGATKLLEIRENAGNTGTYKLLVVTDGEANDSNMSEDSTYNDGTVKPGVIKDIVSRGLIVDAIGLDMNNDHNLSTQINGYYMKGDNPESLTKAVKQSIHAEVNFEDDNVSEDIFEELSQVPDSFANSVISALTTYRNHPIGQKPPKKVINEDGSITYIDNPTEEVSGSGWTLGKILLLIVLVIAVLGLMVFASSN